MLRIIIKFVKPNGINNYYKVFGVIICSADLNKMMGEKYKLITKSMEYNI